MIHVVILTRNRSYNILEVPANGRLVIKEDHLLCGVTQFGVKMIPYGDILTPWEVFIWDNTLSLEMLPSSAFSLSGRVLDFTIIELLQAQETLNPANSGSEVPFQKPTYEEGGLAINYNLYVGGMNYETASAAQSHLSRNTGIVVNALGIDPTGLEKLSVHGINSFANNTFWQVPVTEIYDTTGFIKTFNGSVIKACGATLEIVSFPGITSLDSAWIYGEHPLLKLVEFTGLTQLGDPAIDNGAFIKVPDFSNIRIPKLFETNNAGGVDATVKAALDRGCVVDFV